MSESDEELDPLEALAVDFMERQRRGESPSVAEYAARHPELAAEIEEVFPTIAVMEQLKVHKEHESGARVSLGGIRLERLGDFRILGEIGRGGMGIVYEAYQESLGRHVAVKVLPRQTLLDPQHLRRFQREAQTAARLHHTNIVPVFGVGEHDGFHYIVMQLIEGDLFARFPKLRFIIPHGGGAVPYHWGRYRGLADMLKKPALSRHVMNNVYFDTCVYHQPGVDLLAKVIDSKNILFGSEMVGAVRGIDPETGQYFDDTKRYVDALAIPEAARHAIFEGNARRVFPRLDAKLKGQGK